MSIEVKTKDETKQVATISANNDPEVGNLIADAMEKVGKDGVITVEEAKGMDTTLKVVDGMEFDQGYISPFFITNEEKGRVELDKPLVLLCDSTIVSTQDLMAILQELSKSGKPLLIIADGVEGEALATLVVNKMKGVLKVVAVKAPGYGNVKKLLMEDIAILTGTTVVSAETGTNLVSTTLNDMGQADKVIVTKESCTIVDGAGDPERIKARIDQVKSIVDDIESDYDKEKARERVAKLSGGIAVIKVGAPTETALREKKLRVDDALHATRAAVEEGIISGGGSTFLRLDATMPNINSSDPTEQLGINIVRAAMRAPIKQIVLNAGASPDVVCADVLKEKDPSYGYNAAKNECMDMIKAGIVDPTKVSRSALQNAVSISSLLLTTEALVTKIPEEDGGKNNMGGMPPMGMM